MTRLGSGEPSKRIPRMKPTHHTANLWGLITTKLTSLIPISHTTFPLHSHSTNGAALLTITVSYNSLMFHSPSLLFSPNCSFLCLFFLSFLLFSTQLFSQAVLLFPLDSLLLYASLSQSPCSYGPVVSLLIIALLAFSDWVVHLFFCHTRMNANSHSTSTGQCNITRMNSIYILFYLLILSNYCSESVS